MQNRRYKGLMLAVVAILFLGYLLVRSINNQPSTVKVDNGNTSQEPTLALVLVSTATPTNMTTSTHTPTSMPIETSKPKSTTINSPTPTHTVVPTQTPTQIPPTASPIATKTIETEPATQPTSVVTPISNTNPVAKRGIMLPRAYSFCHDIDTLNAGWYYRNSADPVPDCPTPDPRFVPRFNNAKAINDKTLLDRTINNALASGWLIGFTEPNIPWWDGAVTPREGALAWRKIEEAALPAGIKLVAPSPSQHDPDEHDDYGYTWIWAMVDAYENEYGEKPHFDALGWNYYDNSSFTFQAFFSARHEEALDRGYDIPFWILEYAGECWNTDKYPTGNVEVMTHITPLLEATPWIARYVWFTNRIKAEDSWAPNWHSCTLIDPDTGELTDLGQLYTEQ